MQLLTVHLYVAFVVAALAVVGVWRRPERRITLYVVTLQILLGLILLTQQLRAPASHYALALLGWAGYMVANALARRPAKADTARDRRRHRLAADPRRVLRRDARRQDRHG